ncbi:dihydrofolate reductase family protein [Lichenicola sp.]|uniref:dihydrofolate reductase family protein n=1 Tax=Lichenicola sp. TaxID=2804529 RepID=UPI003AFFC76B
MRDLILKMSMSIDGFVAAADGGIDWIFGPDQEARRWSVEVVSEAGLHIMGSRTFRRMAAHWPTSTDMFSAPMNRIPKVVFSREGPAILGDLAATPPRDGEPAQLQPGAESWAEADVASGDLGADIAMLKARDGKPIVAHGGAGFARSLVAQGLVDRFVLLVHPVALGNGLPIFSKLAATTRLELIGSRAFPGGSVAQTYRPA